MLCQFVASERGLISGSALFNACCCPHSMFNAKLMIDENRTNSGATLPVIEIIKSLAAYCSTTINWQRKKGYPLPQTVTIRDMGNKLIGIYTQNT